jgi:dTDP-L-rhamnose 4-epimerase
VYAVTKRTQEELFLTIGRAYGIPVCVLRYFNAYGSRQSVSNPYTGVAKIFASDLTLGKTPLIYEDGLQTRDFIHVSDIVRANLLALSLDEANGETFNVGSGHPTTILETASSLATLLYAKVPLAPSHMFRAGDVRHCWADIGKIQKQLGFQPRMSFPAGIEEVLAAVKGSQNPGETVVAHDKLAERGLIS